MEIVRYIGCKEKDGEKALHWSAGLGYLDCVTYLVDKDTDINAKDNDGKKALLLSAEYGQLACVKFLVEKKADIKAKNK